MQIEDDVDLDELFQIMFDGYEDVECEECGEVYRIEPDADFRCPECGHRIASSLVKMGVI